MSWQKIYKPLNKQLYEANKNENKLQKNLKNYESVDLLSDQYLVEKIQDKKYVKNQIYYLVKWEGYDSDENTWEPAKNLLEDNLQKLIEEYEQEQLSKIPLRKQMKKKQLKKYKDIKKDHKSFENLQNDLKTGDSSSFEKQNSKKQEKSQNNQILPELNPNGSFLLGDKGIQIMGVKRESKENQLQIKVKWMQRQNGFQPEDQWVDNREIKENQPDLLFEFYESRIKFV